MPPVNRGRSSGYSKCPRCSRHFKDIEGHVSRIHQTTLSELRRLQRSITIQRPKENPNSRQEAPNPRSDDEHISILEDNQQDNPDSHQQEIPNSRQETPTPNSHSNQDNQNSRNIYNHLTFNNCTFNNYYCS
ncbi:27403_t:CDS:1 [Dentiscutata erythropus]|uniref:27403_t:CDS:1 n=1 Tax=Dentiscutata erythropus TaxID=1348616 RepID=A0A9N9IJN4_9GLOM|nr:27403_t:CDS:1 [Dentiscutata erythropus]